MSLPCLYVGIPLSQKELEANDCVSHILCPEEGESAKSTPFTMTIRPRTNFKFTKHLSKQFLAISPNLMATKIPGIRYFAHCCHFSFILLVFDEMMITLVCSCVTVAARIRYLISMTIVSVLSIPQNMEVVPNEKRVSTGLLYVMCLITERYFQLLS